MKFKKITVLLLVFSMVISLCQLGFGKTIVKFWYPWGGIDGDLRVKLAKEFNDTHPDIEVQPLLVRGVGYDDGKLMAAIAGGEPPDVVLYWNGGPTRGMATRDALTDLTPYLDKVGIKGSEYDPALWSQMLYKDKVYGIPELAGIYCSLYYNKNVMIKAGLNPNAPPKDIEQLDLYAEKMTKFDSKGQIDIAGFIPWMEQGGHTDFWPQVFGGKLLNEDETKVTANDPKIIKAFEWMGSYGKKYGAQKFAAYLGSIQDVGNPGHPFYTGKLGMMINGTWVVAQIKKYAPKTFFGIAGNPAPPDGLKNPVYVGMNVWWIPKGAKNVEAALQFIAWMNEKVRMAQTADLVGNLGSKPAARKVQKLRADKYSSVFFKLMDTGTLITEPSSPVWPIYNDLLAKARDKVIYGQATAKEALDEVTAKVQAELDKILKK